MGQRAAAATNVSYVRARGLVVDASAENIRYNIQVTNSLGRFSRRGQRGFICSKKALKVFRVHRLNDSFQRAGQGFLTLLKIDCLFWIWGKSAAKPV